MIVDCGSQLRRAGMAGIEAGLDFNALMAVGTARGVDMALLSAVLPHCENAILAGQADEGNLEVDDA